MKHLSSEQRYKIEILKQNGISITEIAKQVNVHKSTISRECNRNQDKRSKTYNAALAQRKYQQRQIEKPKHLKLTIDMREKILKHLWKKDSPEQIKGYFESIGESCISPERIYQFIWQDKKSGGDLYTHLRHNGKKYQSRSHSKGSRGQIKNRVGIELRPSIVDEKERFGDLEVDLIIGLNHKSALLTINDRSTNLSIIKKITSKNSDAVTKEIIKSLKLWEGKIHTITSDNGKEFAGHQEVSRALEIDWYFANPYHSWERGANENMNGLIRQFVPKKTCFKNISVSYIEYIQDNLNNRPRKKYNYFTPNELYLEKLKNIEALHL